MFLFCVWQDMAIIVDTRENTSVAVGECVNHIFAPPDARTAGLIASEPI